MLKRIITCCIALTLTGCLISERQLSNSSNTAQPIQESAEVVGYKLKNGVWEKSGKGQITKEDGFLYRLIGLGESEALQFAFIPLYGPYYAIETPHPVASEKGKTIFAIAERRGDSFYLWEIADDGLIANSFLSNPSLQQMTGIPCIRGPIGAECKVGSVRDLKNILAHALKLNLQPKYRYQVLGGNGATSNKPNQSIGEAVTSLSFPTWGYTSPELMKDIFDGRTRDISAPKVGIYMTFFLGMFVGADIQECQNVTSKGAVYKFSIAGSANFLGGMSEVFKPNPGGRDEHAKQGYDAGISGLGSAASEAAAQADAQLFFDRHGCASPVAKRFFGNVTKWANEF